MISPLIKKLFVIEREYNFFINKKLKEFGIKKTEIKVIKHLTLDNGVTSNFICTQMVEDKVTIAKSVKKLESLGYLRKVADTKDKRSINLFLTPSGVIVKKEALGSLEELEKLLLEDFSPEEAEESLKYLDRLEKNILSKSERLESLK